MRQAIGSEDIALGTKKNLRQNKRNEDDAQNLTSSSRDLRNR